MYGVDITSAPFLLPQKNLPHRTPPGTVLSDSPTAPVGILDKVSVGFTADYKRGRNGAGAHPKSASAVEYRRATGLEALFGALFLRGETDRIRTLFEVYRAGCEEDAQTTES